MKRQMPEQSNRQIKKICGKSAFAGAYFIEFAIFSFYLRRTDQLCGEQ